MTINVDKVPVIETNCGGNRNAGTAFSILTQARPVSWIQVCWEEQVVKGIAVKFFGDDSVYGKGDWNNRAFAIAAVALEENDVLKRFDVSVRSDFGKGGGVYGVQLQTRKLGWAAGHLTAPITELAPVDKRVLMGIYGSTNTDNFIHSLGLWVNER